MTYHTGGGGGGGETALNAVYMEASGRDHRDRYLE